MSIELRDAPLGNRPKWHYYEVLNAAALAAVTPTAADVGRTYKQLDNESYHTLLDDSPVTFFSHASLADLIASLVSFDASDTDVIDADNVQDALVELDSQVLDNTNGIFNFNSLKANINSPTFTGTPIAATATPGTNTGQLATTAFVAAAVALLLDAPPGALDTLNELAAALGDDANFAATMTTALALKAPLASPGLTGNPTAPTQAADDNSTKLATTAYADTIKALKANIASPTFTGNPAAPTQTAADNSTKLATTAYADAAAAAAGGASLSGTNTWTGVQTYGSGKMVVTSPKVITNFVDVNGNTLLSITATASATRNLGIKNTNGGNPELYVSAGGSNSDLVLRPDGAGKVQAIGGITDNDQWRIQSNSFRPGYADFISPGAGTIGIRVNALQALTQFEFGDNAGGGTISYSSNLISWAISATSGLKIGTATTQKIGAFNATPIVQPAAAAQAALTNSTGGTGDGTLVDVTTTGLADPAKVNDNFTELFTLLNAMRTALVNLGWMKGAA